MVQRDRTKCIICEHDYFYCTDTFVIVVSNSASTAIPVNICTDLNTDRLSLDYECEASVHPLQSGLVMPLENGCIGVVVVLASNKQ